MKHQEFLQHLNTLNKKPVNIMEVVVDDPVEPGQAKAPGDVGGKVAKAAYDATLGAYGNYWNREMNRVSATDAAASERIDREVGELEQATERMTQLMKTGQMTGKQASEMVRNWKKRAEANQAEDKVQNWLETGERVADTGFNVATDALTYSPAYGIGAGLKGLKSAVDVSKAYAGVPTYKSKEENIQNAVEQGIMATTLGALRYAKPITQFTAGLGQKAAAKTVEKVAATKLGKPLVDAGQKAVTKTAEVAGKATQKVGEVTQKAKDIASNITPQTVKDAAARAASTAKNINQRFPYDPSGAVGGAIVADYTAPENAGFTERLARIGTGMFVAGKIAPGLIKPFEAGFKASSIGRGVATAERAADTAIGMVKNIDKMPGAMVDQAVSSVLGKKTVAPKQSDISAAHAAEQGEARVATAHQKEQGEAELFTRHSAEQEEARVAAEKARDEAARLRRNELIKKGKIKPEPPTDGTEGPK